LDEACGLSEFDHGRIYATHIEAFRRLRGGGSRYRRFEHVHIGQPLMLSLQMWATLTIGKAAAEAEFLRRWGQTWKADAPKAKSALPAEAWAMPENSTLAPRKPGWPSTGMIPDIRLPDDLLLPRGRPGRPRRVC